MDDDAKYDITTWKYIRRQSHRRFKEHVEQALLPRGSRDFSCREAYRQFLHELVASRNVGLARTRGVNWLDAVR